MIIDNDLRNYWLINESNEHKTHTVIFQLKLPNNDKTFPKKKITQTHIVLSKVQQQSFKYFCNRIHPAPAPSIKIPKRQFVSTFSIPQESLKIKKHYQAHFNNPPNWSMIKEKKNSFFIIKTQNWSSPLKKFSSRDVSSPPERKTIRRILHPPWHTHTHTHRQTHPQESMQRGWWGERACDYRYSPHTITLKKREGRQRKYIQSTSREGGEPEQQQFDAPGVWVCWASAYCGVVARGGISSQ